MTLIIGVICGDGAVIGADSVATASTTIAHQVSDKITIEEDNVIIACSGSAGLSQLIKEELSESWHNVKQLSSSKDVRNAVSDAMYTQIEPTAKRAKGVGKAFGGCETLVAMPINHTPALFQFNGWADSFGLTSDLPYMSIGSGSRFADPFLEFLKRILWSDRVPNSTRIGVFSVLWTLQHVSKVGPGLGVGEPHRIVVLENRGSGWLANRLGEGELSEHRQAIIDAEDSLRGYGEGLKRAVT